MEQRKPEKDYFETHHLLILGCYTVFAVLLIGEALLLNWEAWALILIAISVCICWTLHIRQLLSEHTRVWIYAILMMVSIFFYGTHVTSTYDLGLLMTVLILIFVSTGIPGLITLGQCTYYLAMVYDLISLYRMGEKFDRLLIIRTLLHFVIMTVICLIARNIIRQWVGIMEKSEEEKQVMSEAADRLNDFLANISHEIRTPVNAVIGLTRICIDKVKDREIKRDLMSVMQAGQKIGDQISDILDYSEVDMGSLAVNEEDYMITSLLHDIVAELSPLKRQDLELVIDVDPRIPATMRSDVTKLKKIIRHLIDNALKYTDEGGVYVHFTPEEREYGINLLIEVTDTGIGMTGVELEKVFERFYQADSGRSRAANGLGLGLSIVNGFTRSLNGFLKIDSEPQVGTTIRVSIPQKVVGNEYCMSIQDPDKLSLGAYLHLEKFRNPHVRAFYNSMVKDMVLGLKVKMQRADNMAGFKKLAQATRFTHVFVGQQEYEEDPEFMKELAKTVMVAVICDASFEIPENPGIRLMRKPFYCVPVISFVNTNRSDLGKVKGRLYARGVRALVVDDENMNLLVARQIFSGYGMKVSTVSSGPEAIDYVLNHEVDLVFMDHMMPGMDGVEAMKRIRGVYAKEKKEVPIVALTANTVSTANEMFLREGFDAFLAKPIVITELERTLKKVLPKSLLTVETSGADQSVSLKASHEAQEETSAGSEGSRMASAEDASYRSGVSESTGSSAVRPENSQETSWEEKLEQLETLGVDTKVGLMYCQNDESFYQELLLQYAGEADGKIRNASMDLEEEDYKNYEILVHAVKSTSKMIGATHLSEAAFVLEKAAKDEDGQTIRRGHESAMEEYRNIADGILSAFGKKTEAKSEADDEVMEFFPEGGADDEILEFFPEGEEDDKILEFGPGVESDDEILEFGPGGEVDDEILEFGPEEEEDNEILEFGPGGETDGYEDDIVEFYPEGSDHP